MDYSLQPKLHSVLLSSNPQIIAGHAFVPLVRAAQSKETIDKPIQREQTTRRTSDQPASRRVAADALGPSPG